MTTQGRGGAIVNIASILGLRVAGHVAAYAASKAGVSCSSRKSLALEWARHGIRVNALCPGYIETDINRDFFATRGRPGDDQAHPAAAPRPAGRSRRRAAAARSDAGSLHDGRDARGRRRPPRLCPVRMRHGFSTFRREIEDYRAPHRRLRRARAHPAGGRSRLL